MSKEQKEMQAEAAGSSRNPEGIQEGSEAAMTPVEQSDGSAFYVSADQLQSLADEVGAALVNYVVRGSRRSLGEEIAVSSMDADEWSGYFRLAFGAVSASEDGVILGDFMFKDTARHRMEGSNFIVTVSAREVEMYLQSAFGPEMTLEAIGKKAQDGNVTFTAMSGEDPDVVEAVQAWHEADVTPGRPLTLEFHLQPAAPAGGAMRLDLWAEAAPDPQYGCFVTAYRVKAM